jgi:hypothetical protein
VHVFRHKSKLHHKSQRSQTKLTMHVHNGLKIEQGREDLPQELFTKDEEMTEMHLGGLQDCSTTNLENTCRIDTEQVGKVCCLNWKCLTLINAT